MPSELELPPVMRIAAEEDLWRFDRPSDLARFMRSRGLISELRRQSDWTLSSFRYVDDLEPSPVFEHAFVVAPSGSLNPFSGIAKCNGPSCRERAAQQFVQSVGLYSDLAILPDPITLLTLDTSKLSGAKLGDLFQFLQVFKVVYPLIQAGVVRFAAPFAAYCRECYDNTRSILSDTTEALSQVAEQELVAHYDPADANLFIEIPSFYPDEGHAMGSSFDLSEAQRQEYVACCGRTRVGKTSRKCRQYVASLLRKRIALEVHHIFMELAIAKHSHCTLLAGSRIEPLVLSHLERKAPVARDLCDWEKLRTVPLPWLSQLTADEIVALRNEASNALPKLRELLLKRLSTPHESQVTAVVQELREQVQQVRDELSTLRRRRESRYRKGFGALALTLVIYGLATAVPQAAVASVAALMAALAHLRVSERDHEAAESRAKSTPAYALICAQQRLLDRARSL